jgi:arylsulfatase/arylsulfatase A
MSKVIACVGLMTIVASEIFAADRPNVLIVLTDDQGYGDLGYHKNPILKTPNIDAFAKAGVRMTQFYVSPVCSPTRASLMTGRYNYRTGVVDTFLGRAMMHTDEVTIAEVLRDDGYRTALFGKWHLGDCYPMRPQDQGFEEVLMHRGGGIAQPSDPPGGSSYTDPILFHNGEAKKFKGYVTDVLTDAATDFITAKSDKPFFAYVAYNCPHAPYQVSDDDWKPYRGIDLGPDAFPKIGSPWAGKKLNQEEIGKAYGMIANIDKNFGRLLAKIPDNTLVIFFSDNGPGGVRWNAGLRNRKGTVYEGGLRVPCFVQWKGKLESKDVDVSAAHIDLGPTILDACGCSFPKGITIDGRSLLPQWKGDKINWRERNLFFQWHRGDVPEQSRAFAVRGPRYKLVQAAGVNPGKYEPNYELFDLQNDPYEEKNVFNEEHKSLAAKMLLDYGRWFEDVKGSRNFDAPRIHIGSPKEKWTTLTRQDWRGPKAGWTPESEGHWDVTVTRPGTYRVQVDFDPAAADRSVHIKIGNATAKLDAAKNKDRVVFDRVALTKGDAKVEAWLEGPKRVGAKFVEVERIGD